MEPADYLKVDSTRVSLFGAIEVYRVEDPGGSVVSRLSVGHHWEIGRPLGS